jgi:hypothetical protein
MSRMIPAAKRIELARGLIEKARQVAAPPEMGRNDLSYIAEVKDVMRQARDMIKFISYTPTASAEMKAEVAKVFEEIAQAEREILRGKP